MPRQKMIALSPEEYIKLRNIKEETERRSKMNFDWGSFIMGAVTDGLIAGIVSDIVKEGENK